MLWLSLVAYLTYVPAVTDAPQQFPISEERKREMVTSGSSGDFKDFTCD